MRVARRDVERERGQLLDDCLNLFRRVSFTHPDAFNERRLPAVFADEQLRKGTLQ
jgi:hypothetical protein